MATRTFVVELTLSNLHKTLEAIFKVVPDGKIDYKQISLFELRVIVPDKPRVIEEFRNACSLEDIPFFEDNSPLVERI